MTWFADHYLIGICVIAAIGVPLIWWYAGWGR